jgi:hypothetical protein
MSAIIVETLINLHPLSIAWAFKNPKTVEKFALFNPSAKGAALLIKQGTLPSKLTPFLIDHAIRS